MIKKEYDAIVVGGGNNGLCLGAYLQRAGMEVAIFERRHEEGGCICTRETTAPGFLHNHAVCMEFMDWMPFYYDFGLEKLGARTIHPDAEFGIPFSDGSPPIILYNMASEENYERTHKSISVYSKKDADTWVELLRKVQAMEALLPQFFYNPPPMPTPDDPDPFQTLTTTLLDIVGLPHHLAQGSGKGLVDYLFEAPALRTLMYKGLEDWGTSLELKGFGAFGVLSLCFGINYSRIMMGGTHTLAHAMVSACVREGVEFHERGDVKKILVENGKAVGVRLADGTEVRARKLVASNADLKQTLLGMVGEENLSAHWIERTKAFRYGRSGVLGSVHMALNEAPDYKSAKHNPDINRTFITVVGVDTPEEMVEHVREAEAGKVPTIPALFNSCLSVFDPTYAPPGKHALSAWIFFPKASDLTREEWYKVKKTYNDRVIERFEKWAPNMTRANVISDFFETPLDLQDDKGIPEGDFTLGGIYPDQMAHNRPFREAALYRAEVEALYLCSSGQHPVGGASAAAGYNAYKIVAEDFGLSYKPWDTTGRGY